MTEMTLTKTRLVGGIWEGVLSGAGDETPALRLSHRDLDVAGLTVKRADGGADWYVQVPVPNDLIADGVQTFVISDVASGEVLASFALLSGEALSEDIRAEMDLLRAELDMLKRAFRRHCVETM